jgi:hypothetical protein
MKKTFLALSSLAIIITLGIALSSCKDDEKPSKANVSFTSETKTVQETAGTIEVKVSLDRAVSTDVIVGYELSGTALEKAGLNEGDYEVEGDVGEVTILKGETTGTIKFKIVNDLKYEAVDKIIIISLTDISSGDAVISTDDETQVIIQSDDTGSTASFASTTLSVVEGDENVQIEIKLDVASSEDITIGYTLSGTAVDSVKADGSTTLSADYAIQDETPGQITIPKGETSAKITIDMYWDFALEDNDYNTLILDPETIKITLEENTGGIVNTSKDEMNINLKQEDGIIVELDWNYTTVNLDLGIWWGTPDIELIAVLQRSTSDPNYLFEQVFLPKVWVDGLKFGLSYIYKSGDKEPMEFQVAFIDVIDGTIEPFEDWLRSDGSYTLANLNAWTTLADVTQTEQTFEFVDNTFTNFSDLTVPTNGSRSGRQIKYPSIRTQKLNLKADRRFLK